MLKVALFLLAAALAACVTQRDERVAAIQAELPQLVDACNGAFRDGSPIGLGIVVISQGIDACDRLAQGRSLALVRPTTAELYQRYRVTRDYHAAERARVAVSALPQSSQTSPDPAGAALVSIQNALATFPGAPPPGFPFPR